MIKTGTAALAIMAASAEALLNLEVNLPLGINVDLDLFGPSEEPCVECIDLWHPAHDVIIDDCDDTDSWDWHWVHPCPEPHEPEYTWTTSTVTATHVSTVIDCPPEVPECPGHSTVYTTVTVSDETTICPVPVTSTHPPPIEHPTTSEEYHPPPTTEIEHPPTTTEMYHPPTTTPKVHPPPVETHVPQPPPVSEHSSSVWTDPVPTLSTSVHVPHEPMPEPEPEHKPTEPVHPPVEPPVHTPVVPHPPMSHTTYGDNATVPATTPVVTHPPAPTGAAGRNTQNVGLAVAAGAFAAYIL